MRAIFQNLVILLFVVAVSYASEQQHSQIAVNSEYRSLSSQYEGKSKASLHRQRRQLENFDDADDEYQITPNKQEEPGFWDRVVNVALKLFNKFIEWLNSS